LKIRKIYAIYANLTVVIGSDRVRLTVGVLDAEDAESRDHAPPGLDIIPECQSRLPTVVGRVGLGDMPHPEPRVVAVIWLGRGFDIYF
jgi:hypothetical protein